MAIYVIGDIQGCFDTLQALLKQLAFKPPSDQLWLTGDLVNRGPKSLETLRYLYSLGDACITVLGNHDLHLLSCYYYPDHLQRGDTLQKLLDITHNPDLPLLMAWLRKKPLCYLHTDPQSNLHYCLTHAGLPPQWSIQMAQTLSNEASACLQSPAGIAFLSQLHGNLPDQWDPHLSGIDRIRYIINALTRMRLCTSDGRLALGLWADARSDQSPHSPLIPWFEYPDTPWHQEQMQAHYTLLFGHWSALRGQTHRDDIIALDTGCVWNQTLTALNLETRERIAIQCIDQVG
jgi:bis(5'-nucleosyl)-tetraphosphatase (symmetrical)